MDGASLEIATGSITGLIGPNGAGKSTVFHLISGNLRPTSGEIVFDGESITGDDVRRFHDVVQRVPIAEDVIRRHEVREGDLLFEEQRHGELEVFRIAVVEREDEAVRDRRPVAE